MQLCLDEFGCKCQDAANNTYRCLRTLVIIPPSGAASESQEEEDSLYCEFDDSEAFVELYDMRRDPYQLHNKASRQQQQRQWNRKSAGPSVVVVRGDDDDRRYNKLLDDYYQCRGHVNCFRPS